MTTDLIARLRGLANCEHDDVSIGTEAADEIDRLGYLNTAVDKLTERRDALLAERAALRAALTDACAIVQRYRVEVFSADCAPDADGIHDPDVLADLAEMDRVLAAADALLAQVP